MPHLKRSTVFILAGATVLVSGILLLISVQAAVFNGPPSGCTAPGCTGAIGVNAANSVSVGTSTPNGSAKAFILASSTSAADDSLLIDQPSGNPILIVRNDGSMSIGTTTEAGNALVVNGTIFSTGNFSGNVSANNVTAGTFPGAGNYAFSTSLGVDTSTAVGLPETLSVYGGGYFSNSVGIGTTTPAQPLSVQGNIYASGNITCGGTCGGGSSQWTTVGGSSTIYYNGGNVGIGTSSPIFSLEVPGTVGIGTLIGDASGTQSPDDTLILGNAAGNFFIDRSPNSTNGQIIIGYNSPKQSAGAGVFQVYNNATDHKALFQVFSSGTASGANQVIIANSAVGIGTSTPAYRLSVQGDVYASGNITCGGTCGGGGSSQWTTAGGSIYYTGGDVLIGTSTAADTLTVYTGTNDSGIQLEGAGAAASVSPTIRIANSAGTVYTRIGIAGTAGNLVPGTAVDDTVIRTENQNLWFTTNGGSSAAMEITSTGTVLVGGGTGKITVGTVDPAYTIDGEKFATYGADITGVKGETTGNADFPGTSFVPGQTYSYTLDLAGAPQGSDLWLFKETTQSIQNNMEGLVVILTPNFDGNVWYGKNPTAGTVTVFAKPSEPTTALEVGYRLTAPRFDASQWGNTAPSDAPAGFIIND